ncbi:MAG: diguanylate cyclase [Proteobacteria bacterium]|nr:diguanylate cyclase [Pseudomonadota bacterium]
MRPASWTSRFAIRTRLVVLLLTLAVPFLVYVALSARRQIDLEQVEAGQRMLGMARLTAARLDDHIGDIHQLLGVLRAVAGATTADAARNDAILGSLTPTLPPHINNLAVWSADGANVGSLHPALRDLAIDVRKRAFFQRAMGGAEIAVEAPARAQLNGQLVGIFAMPIRRDGHVVGVVTASTLLEPLQKLLLPEEALPPGAVITVSDASGVVLARSIDPEHWIGRNLLQRGGVADSLRRREGIRDGPSADGIERIAGFTTSERAPWLVYVGVPTQVALAGVRKRLYETLGAGTLLLAVGLALATRIGGRIASPLRQLGDDAAALERGDLTHRSRVAEGGEIGLLAATVNRMADALQERTALLESSRERLSLALEGSGLALFDWDIATDRIYLSAGAAVLRGAEPREATGRTPAELREHLHPDDDAVLDAALRSAVRGDTPRFLAEFRIRNVHGDWIWMQGRGRVVERDADGRALRLAGTLADITERRAADERLRHLAEFDALTGLPNRALFLDRLEQAMARANRRCVPIGLLFLDIDRFKGVNDSLGHAAGDALLMAFAEMLRGSVRTSDTVARLGGDEFTVILEDLHGLADAQRLAATLVENARRTVVPIGDQQIAMSTSIGIAMQRLGEADRAALLQRADTALYEAKRRGRDGHASAGDAASTTHG